MKRILSGIQPSGKLHIGNYFGMMQPMLAHMESAELYVFIVDLHALTSVQDRDRLRQGTLEAADIAIKPLKPPSIPRDRRRILGSRRDNPTADDSGTQACTQRQGEYGNEANSSEPEPV